MLNQKIEKADVILLQLQNITRENPGHPSEEITFCEITWFSATFIKKTIKNNGLQSVSFNIAFITEFAKLALIILFL